ncbi:MAG: multidrug efflux RND transporter permease subunit [Candidatus Melainabacteria bacterium]|nr:multidrug efflux RND transporter permease subunit [Candidatus Melainabacteria bacterium]
MLSDYFIQRPIFASVIAAVIVLLGAISALYLPIQQYPDIAPPKVVVMGIYNGANAETVESAVTTPLEQEINGVEGMKYIQSTSTNDGLSMITVTFGHDRDVDKAVMDVKNRVDIALGRLPQEVKATGVTVQKESEAFIMGIGFFSPDGRYDHKFISNYVERFVVERLKRIRGLGRINMFGERKYAMRLWLDPVKMAARQLSVMDVTTALQEQNAEVPAGQIGQLPMNAEHLYQLPVLVQGRLRTEKDFNNLVLRYGPNGSVVRLADVGRAELGAEDYSKTVRWQRHNSVGFGLVQLPGTNALQLAQQVRDELEAMKAKFPEGMTYDVGFDPTTFIDASIKEVNKTLLEAIFFVVLVIFIFLQNWRTTVIPALTIPVSLVGTFFVMNLFGFSINLLTMFGIILATGIVVDDAIVVIENISRQMEEDPSLTPLQAAHKGMQEVFGAVVATALVLIAVFAPVSFFPGTTGLLYQQFALTIAFSVAISAFNAITLTPALSAIFLKPSHGSESQHWFFRPINRVLNAINRFYATSIRQIIQLRLLVMVLFVALVGLTLIMFSVVPKGFIPTEDQGYFIVAAQAPEGTSHDYMRKVAEKVEDIIMPHPEINGVFAINGFGFGGNAPNRAIMFVPLKSIEDRKHHDQSAAALIEKVRGPLMSIPEAIVIPFEPPAIQGIGNMGGFQFFLQDRSGASPLSELAQAQFQIMGESQKNSALTGVFATFNTDSPLLKIDLKRDWATALGVPVGEVTRTLQVLLGSAYVNDFTFENRSYRVYAQADHAYRENPRVFDSMYVRRYDGTVLPLKNLVSIQQATGPQIITHFNLFRATEINGAPAPRKSSGEAIEAMETLASHVPKQFGFEWSGLYLEQLESGGQTLLFLALGIVFVYLVLAAQYESFVDPFIIVLSVPLAMLGALLATQIRGFDNNVFTQIGMILLIGLASKNAILIVEFANQLRAQGQSTLQAAIQASILRFRPIVMTSLAFIIGVVPLVFADGAGSAARQVIGTTVFGGMILSTLLSLFIVPVQYVLIKTLEDRMRLLFKRWTRRKAVSAG